VVAWLPGGRKDDQARPPGASGDLKWTSRASSNPTHLDLHLFGQYFNYFSSYVRRELILLGAADGAFGGTNDFHLASGLTGVDFFFLLLPISAGRSI